MKYGRLALLLALTTGGCSGKSQLALHYVFNGLDPTAVERVETLITVDPKDMREFYADQPYRSVATGIGYEVGDFNGSTTRALALYHDGSLGWTPTAKFTFTLLPPSGESPPALDLIASAYDAQSNLLSRTSPMPATFGDDNSVTLTLTDERCGGKVVCDTAQSCCNKSCINTSSDPTNCGGCGKSCSTIGDACSGATCTCAGGSACSGTSTCCSGTGCFELSTDPNNCGQCGNACNPGESCVGGSCQCPSNAGQAACAAGDACCAGTGCSSTGCACGGSNCAAPNSCCNDTTCVNLQDTDTNCGTCGKSCAAPLHCSAGACACNGQVCSGSNTCCTTGSSPGCADLTSSTANCGSCGHSCQLNEMCAGSKCQCGSGPSAPTCTEGQICCGNSCVNDSSDFYNCGGCGIQCHTGEQCSSGHCLCPGQMPPRACLSTELCCPAEVGSTGSIGAGCYFKNDNNHCGTCTTECKTGQQCTLSNGTLQCEATPCNPACTNGDTCNNGVCSCNGAACPPASPIPGDSYSCCNSSCVDLDTDVNNCGSCGAGMGNATLCCDGVPTQHNNSNCGSCGDVCGTGSECCQTGGVWACTLYNDPKNCGSCGNVCSASVGTTTTANSHPAPDVGGVGGYQCCAACPGQCTLSGVCKACIQPGG